MVLITTSEMLDFKNKSIRARNGVRARECARRCSWLSEAQGNGYAGTTGRRSEWRPCLMPKAFVFDIVIIGGCGHVGLPLGIALAHRGARVAIYDVSESAVKSVNDAVLPFDEPGAAELLREAIH